MFVTLLVSFFYTLFFLGYASLKGFHTCVNQQHGKGCFKCQNQ